MHYFWLSVLHATAAKTCSWKRNLSTSTTFWPETVTSCSCRLAPVRAQLPQLFFSAALRLLRHATSRRSTARSGTHQVTSSRDCSLFCVEYWLLFLFILLCGKTNSVEVVVVLETGDTLSAFGLSWFPVFSCDDFRTLLLTLKVRCDFLLLLMLSTVIAGLAIHFSHVVGFLFGCKLEFTHLVRRL